jgi:translation initiation factor IF-2
LNNKQQKQSHAESSIESLKMLSQQHSDEHFLHLLKKVQSARRSLEVLYQTVSEKRRKLVGEKEVLEAQKTIANNDSKQPQEDKKPSTPRKRQEQKEFSRPNAAGAKKEYGQKPYQKQNSYKESGAASYNHAKPRPFSSSNTAPVVEEVETTTVRNKFANSNLNKKPSSNDYDKKAKTLNKKQLLKRNLIDDGRDGDRIITRKPKKKNKNAVVAPPKVIEHAVITTDNLTVKLLAEAIGKPVTEIVKKLFLLGVMATINSVIDFDIAELVAGELGITLEKKVEKTYEEKLTDLMETEQDDAKDLKPRAPIVTVMGHVDHGKTSLLDSIRQTNVISGEAGGITQNIGAYTVKTEKGKITFIDTPGHAAFTEMRARGAKVTDIAILVVAADDGIMPQTVEAINHIKAADVPMVVAINKIDKPHANVEHNVLAEDWGGDTIMVPVSAHTKEGLDTLLDMIVLVAEVKELKANPKRDGIGTVIEAKLDKGRGPVATIIVQNGTLKVGDSIVAGVSSGRIRAMVDDQGKEIKKATPSMPVAVIGFDSVPEAGSIANVVEDKMMKELVLERENKQKEERFTAKPMNLDDLFSKAKSGNLKTLNIIIKANVSGVMEALKQSLEKIKNEEVTVRCIHGAAGAINENDVLLAQTADAIIIGFNVRPDVNAKKLAEKNNIDIRYYSIIYNAIDDIEAAIKGMLAPKFEEVVIGHAEVRVLYKISKLGTIAGCMVKDGRITRASSIRVLRNNTVLADTSIDTLRIQKDDVKEVKSGFECGIKLAGFNDFKEGDVLEAYLNEQIKN